MGEHDQAVLHGGDAHADIHDDGRRFHALGFDETPDIDSVAFSASSLVPVFRYSGDKFINDAIRVHIRPFLVTKWESLYSTLFGTGVKPTRFEPDGVEPSFTPVIDESYRVVGHLGWINMSQICIFTALDGTALDLQKAEPTRLSEEHWRRLWRLDHPSGLRLPPGLLKPATNSPPPRQPPPCRPSSASPPLKPDFGDDDAFWDSLRRAPRKESEEQRHQNNFNFFLAAGGTALVGRAIAVDLWDSERDEMYGIEGYRCLALVGPDGHLQGVLGVEKIHYHHESRNERDLRLVLEVVDIALTIWTVIDIVTIPVVLFRLGRMAAKEVMIWALEVNVNREAKAALKAAEQEAKRLAEAAAREAAEAASKKGLRGLETIPKEELAKAWGAGPRPRPLTDSQLERAIELLRNGQDVHVESLEQMRQIQGELGQLGVRSESSSTIIPQRPKFNKAGVSEMDGSYLDGPGTYRSDPPHKLDKVLPDGSEKIPHSSHNEYPHINITLPNGKKLAVIVTGSKSF